jgi:hypothetical protein
MGGKKRRKWRSFVLVLDRVSVRDIGINGVFAMEPGRYARLVSP